MAVMRTETRNQAGEIVQTLTSKVVVLRRPA
jgi:acyl dehydratase